jgi:uncharacterized protein with von Willebrand factor type A (vWA) domain
MEADFKTYLKMNMATKDVENRVSDYFSLALSIVEEHGHADKLGELFPINKLFCKFLVQGLQPEELRDEVTSCLKFPMHEGVNKKTALLYELIKNKAVEQQRLHERAKRINSKRSKNVSSEDAVDGASK